MAEKNGRWGDWESRGPRLPLAAGLLWVDPSPFRSQYCGLLTCKRRALGSPSSPLALVFTSRAAKPQAPSGLVPVFRKGIPCWRWLGCPSIPHSHPHPVESHLQRTRSQKWPRVMGKETMHKEFRDPGWAQTPRVQRAESIRQVSRVASLLVRDPESNTLGREEETGSCLGVPGLMGRQDAQTHRHFHK